MQIFVAIAIATALANGAAGVSLNQGSKGNKVYPVSKVVKLLKDMKGTLEKEAEEDEEVYDKVACWCHTNDKAKTQAIKDAEARITDLTSTIEQATARSARLTTEIDNLNGELKHN